MHEQGRENNVAAPRVKRGRARLIGFGLDDAEGHVRYTRGQGMELYGGSEEAHADMQRRAQIIQSQIDALGISLDRMTYEEFLKVKAIVDRANAE